MNKKFQQSGIFETYLSVDEEMVPYFGRHSAKMFLRGKPVRFGFKLWCLCSSSGYMFKYTPYCGKSDFVDASFGLGASVVLELLRIVDNPNNHAVYCDNFFTSHSLLCELRAAGFCATGTVRQPRLNNCPLIDSKELVKKGRGSHDWQFDSDEEILAVKWNDNATVCVASNFEEIDPQQEVKRYSRAEKKSVRVQQPLLINSYNKRMGGVDLHDSFVAKYRIRVKGKKWWWPLFLNAIDATLVNAWRLYRMARGGRMDLLQFRRKIAVTY